MKPIEVTNPKLLAVKLRALDFGELTYDEPCDIYLFDVLSESKIERFFTWVFSFGSIKATTFILQILPKKKTGIHHLYLEDLSTLKSLDQIEELIKVIKSECVE